jgi:hypothetical protein
MGKHTENTLVSYDRKKIAWCVSNEHTTHARAPTLTEAMLAQGVLRVDIS